MICFFREKKGEKEAERMREREKHWWEKETSICCPLYTPWLGMEPITWACSLTTNWTHNLLVYEAMIQTTKPHWQEVKGVLRLHPTLNSFNSSFKLCLSVSSVLPPEDCHQPQFRFIAWLPHHGSKQFSLQAWGSVIWKSHCLHSNPRSN